MFAIEKRFATRAFADPKDVQLFGRTQGEAFLFFKGSAGKS